MIRLRMILSVAFTVMLLPHTLHFVHEHVRLLLQNDVHVDLRDSCIVALVPLITGPNEGIVVATVTAATCVDKHTNELVRLGRRSVRLGHALANVELERERHVLVEADLLAIHVTSKALQVTDEDGRGRR